MFLYVMVVCCVVLHCCVACMLCCTYSCFVYVVSIVYSFFVSPVLLSGLQHGRTAVPNAGGKAKNQSIN